VRRAEKVAGAQEGPLSATLTRDGAAHRWAPVSAPTKIPSLVDEDGLFFTSAAVPQLLVGARIEEVEQELRAQIGAVARAGLRQDRAVPAVAA